MIGAGLIAGAQWARRVRRVERRLEEERVRLLAGEHEAVAAASATWDESLDELSRAAPPETAGAEADLRRIREAAERNRRLLEAVLDGAAEARREIEEARRGGAPGGYARLSGVSDTDRRPTRDHRA